MPKPQFEAIQDQRPEQAPEDPEPLDPPLGSVESVEIADKLEAGGIYITPEGDVIEKTPPQEVSKGGGCGVTVLPYFQDSKQGLKLAEEVSINRPAKKPSTTSMGIETEFGTYDDKTGETHHYSKDGKTINYPDGSSKTADEVGHTAEATSFTTERKKLLISDDPDNKDAEQKMIRLDPSNYLVRFIRFLRADKNGLAERGIRTPGLSMHPYKVEPSDVTDDEYMKNHYKDGMFEDFAGVMGIHVNVEAWTPEDGLFALNFAQTFQPLFSALSAASPFRDGRTDTTLGQHYAENPSFTEDKLRQTLETNGLNETEIEIVLANYKKMLEIVSEYDEEQLGKMDIDWRQLSRIHASPSGGILTHPTHLTLGENLSASHKKLQGNVIPTADRLYGQHTSRYCHKKGKGVVEICDLSRAGDNPNKLAALLDTVFKTVVALQAYHSDPNAQAKYKESWAGLIPTPAEMDDSEARKRYIDVANTNSVITTLYGKNRQQYDANAVNESGSIDNTVPGRSPQEILEILYDFIETVIPQEPVSEVHKLEMFATLQPAPKDASFIDADDAIDRFFEPKSNMTAAECLQIAARIEPSLSINELILKFDKRCAVELENYDQEIQDLTEAPKRTGFFPRVRRSLARTALGVLAPVGIGIR